METSLEGKPEPHTPVLAWTKNKNSKKNPTRYRKLHTQCTRPLCIYTTPPLSKQGTVSTARSDRRQCTTQKQYEAFSRRQGHGAGTERDA